MARDKKGKAKGRTSKPVDMFSDKKFQVEHGLRVLKEAEDIMGNKSLMKDIGKEANDQVKVLQRLKGKFK